MIDDARTRDSDVDDSLWLAHAVKRARHERIIFDGIGEAGFNGAAQHSQADAVEGYGRIGGDRRRSVSHPVESNPAIVNLDAPVGMHVPVNGR